MNSDPQFGSTTASVEDLRLGQIIRSDALAKLNEFRKLNPVLREVIEEPVQIQLVLDACIVQQELRFRLRHKKKREARTSLQEILDSGTVLPFAPPKLIEEVEEHVEEIATYCNVSEDRVRQEWADLRTKIHFYEPEIQNKNGCIDPDDEPYRQVCVEIGANAVYTKDDHFKSMGVPTIMIDLDRVLRKHARASSIKLGVSVGSAFTLVISVNVLKELMTLAAKGIQKIPTPVKIAFLVAIAAALIHPRSRAKVIEAGKILWRKLNDPRFKAILSSLTIQTFEAFETAENTSKEIKASLPSPRKRRAINFARQVCAVEKRPLTLGEIASLMKKAGYVTRSKTFTAYLRRLLRGSTNFIETSPGYWNLKLRARSAA
jgi:predicted nucleic acid-binding protein